MKYIKNPLQKILLSCLLVFSIATLTTAQERTKKIDRILNKQLAKIWNDASIQQQLIDTKADLELDLFFDGNSLYRLLEKEELQGYLLLRRGFGCKIGGCGDASLQGEGQLCSANGGAYEVFDYALILDTSMTILKVLVVDYPGDYGYEITSKGWLKQFIGYKGKPIRYGKEIDAISGATISANSITSDIVAVHEMLEYFLIEKNLVVVD